MRLLSPRSACFLLLVLVGCRIGGLRDRFHDHEPEDTPPLVEPPAAPADEPARPKSWKCADDGTRCACSFVEECTFGFCPHPISPVPYCGTYEVCTLVDPTYCVCRFLDEATSAPNGTRVTSCPPDEEGARLASDLCASEGVPCALAALSEANLGACCEGLVCDLAGAGGFRCRVADESDEDALFACRRAGALLQSPLELRSELVTNQGGIPVTRVGSYGAALRADGSVERASLHISDKNDFCKISIEVESPSSDEASPAVSLVSVRGFLCGLASPEDFSTSTQTASVGTLTVEPRVHCEGDLDRLCVHGRFTIEITDPIPAVRGTAQLTFLAPIVIEGTLCGDPK